MLRANRVSRFIVLISLLVAALATHVWSQEVPKKAIALTGLRSHPAVPGISSPPLGVEPDDKATQLRRAYLLSWAGQQVPAQMHFLAFIKTNPDHVDAHIGLA